MTPKKRAQIESEWDGLFFGVRRTVRYHLHRRKFFATLKVITDFLVIASGGTVVSLASSTESKSGWVIFSGAVTAIVGTLDLVLGFSDKARDHRDLVEAFSDLEAEMTADAIAKERLIEFTNKRLKLEVDEPPTKQVLNKYCHNELVIALDCPQENLAEIGFWQSLLKQFVDINPQNIKTFKQIEDARIAKEKAAAAATSVENAAEIGT